ncbi:SET domain-containing protein 4 isoform X1 [Dendroctonus ponderosae]|uniref:SET domain-containing protein 4 isoform X1 n=2 Tax=Dendroctonus ponderosae TaxID=77166 RepID=UPI002035D9EF|nr:SET domain-containing protein 4 isoform X1 [Dendroctonus ponderosae]
MGCQEGMGRTKRHRSKNRHQPNSLNLSNDPAAISLKQWLKSHEFADPLKLQLRSFADTGRGVTSTKSVRPLDVLMRIPFDLLITFDTIRKSKLVGLLTRPLSIQTLLALFLVKERHKGAQSEWKSYIDSLPYPEPGLPWMEHPDEIELYPEDLKYLARNLQGNFQECLESARKALAVDKGLEYLLEEPSLRWAYVLVNTRAVYVDPEYLMSKDSSNVELLADAPFLALCPYLDLINHHYLAKTKATVVSVEGRAFYELASLSGFKRYEQFFISYGAHSNEKLLMEYGFFIPGNLFDFVRISLQEILDSVAVSLDDRQYKYIKNYEFHADDLYVNENGASFVLKAILFVGSYPNIVDYASYIFSNRYPNDFEQVLSLSTRRLLEFKLAAYRKDVKILPKSNSEVMNDFLRYRVQYVERLLNLLDENKLCFS